MFVIFSMLSFCCRQDVGSKEEEGGEEKEDAVPGVRVWGLP
jgi:hypothetical protein